ncbi:hypothetical protein CHCC20375_3734 [Bacillus licheniformis]|nr:hypothetical protein CHCC20375_3734 [Bacillus licheniformis]
MTPWNPFLSDKMNMILALYHKISSILKIRAGRIAAEKTIKKDAPRKDIL